MSLGKFARMCLFAGALALAITLPSATSRADRHDREGTSSAAPRTDPSWLVLREALLSRDYATRLLVTEALGDIRGVDVTSWLHHMLRDTEHDVRVAAVEALRRIGSTHAFSILKTVRDDREESLDVRALAAAALLAGTAGTR